MTNDQERANPCRRYVACLPDGTLATLQAFSEFIYLSVASNAPDFVNCELDYLLARLVNGRRLNGHRWLPFDQEELVQWLINDPQYPVTRIH